MSKPRSGRRLSTTTVLGFDGHGVQSWAAQVVLRLDPLLIGFQVAAGGAYTDPVHSARRLRGVWGILKELLHELDRPEVRTCIPPGQLLVALDSDIVEGRWAWMNSEDDWDSAAW